jgi:hypothetical protein
MWSEQYAQKLNPDRDIILGEVKKHPTKGVQKVKERLQKEHLK